MKLGGEVVAAPHELQAVLADVAQMVDQGWRVLLCHGGGPQTTALGRRLGLEPRQVAGQRVTDESTLRVACQAIAGEVGCGVVAAAWAAGVSALGISAGIIHARQRPPVELASGERVDYGRVGDVVRLELGPVRACWDLGVMPVLNPIGVSEGTAELLNINADTVARALATALAVEHLFAVTSVGGVLRDRHDPSSRIATLTPAQARAAIADGTVVGGMIPKVEEAIAALEGVGAVHIIPPEPGALVAAAAEPGSRGTVIR